MPQAAGPGQLRVDRLAGGATSTGQAHETTVTLVAGAPWSHA